MKCRFLKLCNNVEFEQNYTTNTVEPLIYKELGHNKAFLYHGNFGGHRFLHFSL